MIFFFYLKSRDSEKPIRLEGDSRVVEGQFCIVRKNGEIVGQVDWADVICWHDERAVPET